MTISLFLIAVLSLVLTMFPIVEAAAKMTNRYTTRDPVRDKTNLKDTETKTFDGSGSMETRAANAVTELSEGSGNFIALKQEEEISLSGSGDGSGFDYFGSGGEFLKLADSSEFKMLLDSVESDFYNFESKLVEKNDLSVPEWIDFSEGSGSLENIETIDLTQDLIEIIDLTSSTPPSTPKPIVTLSTQTHLVQSSSGVKEVKQIDNNWMNPDLKTYPPKFKSPTQIVKNFNSANYPILKSLMETKSQPSSSTNRDIASNTTVISNSSLVDTQANNKSNSGSKKMEVIYETTIYLDAEKYPELLKPTEYPNNGHYYSPEISSTTETGPNTHFFAQKPKAASDLYILQQPPQPVVVFESDSRPEYSQEDFERYYIPVTSRPISKKPKAGAKREAPMGGIKVSNYNIRIKSSGHPNNFFETILHKTIVDELTK